VEQTYGKQRNSNVRVQYVLAEEITRGKGLIFLEDDGVLCRRISDMGMAVNWKNAIVPYKHLLYLVLYLRSCKLKYASMDFYSYLSVIEEQRRWSWYTELVSLHRRP